MPRVSAYARNLRYDRFMEIDRVRPALMAYLIRLIRQLHYSQDWRPRITGINQFARGDVEAESLSKASKGWVRQFAKDHPEWIDYREETDEAKWSSARFVKIKEVPDEDLEYFIRTGERTDRMKYSWEL